MAQLGKGPNGYALGSSGRLAQRESAAFTRLRSSFRNALIHWALGVSCGDLRHICDAFGSRNYPRVPIPGAWLIDCSRSPRLPEFLAVSQSTLRRWLRGRQIEHVRLGRSVRIRSSVLERWLNDRTVQPTDYASLL